MCFCFFPSSPRSSKSKTPRDESESRLIALAELLKLQGIGHFPDEPVKIEDVQIHHGDDRVLEMAGVKAIA